MSISTKFVNETPITIKPNYQIGNTQINDSVT